MKPLTPISLWASNSICYTMEWYRRERIKADVSAAFQRALRTSALVRPAHCVRCGGSTAGSRSSVVGHHPDYSRPMLVTWLCYGCHAREHAAIRSNLSADPYRKCGPITVADMVSALRHRVGALARQDRYIMRARAMQQGACPLQDAA